MSPGPSAPVGRVRPPLAGEIVSAVPLDDARFDRIVAELERLSRRSLVLRRRVDPSILGGLVVRVADRRLDLSLARRLDDLRSRLSPPRE